MRVMNCVCGEPPTVFISDRYVQLNCHDHYCDCYLNAGGSTRAEAYQDWNNKIRAFRADKKKKLGEMK